MPRVATHLVRHGTDIWEDKSDYPDVTPLYLAIAHPDTKALDGALRIACSYALPRTAEHLLVRGADPNSLSRFGLAAIHLAVMKRLPWRKFALMHILLGQESIATFNDDSRTRWNTMLVRTVSALLRFGGDPNLRSTVSRAHSCGHKCWRSPDCIHRGQRVLHMACGNGTKEVVNVLLQYGADQRIPDDEGHLPLFSAICQDHDKLALGLLRHSVDPAQLIIVQPHRSTALHVACRFASLEVMKFLLQCGADANITDSFGRTPLQEAMGQNCGGLEDRVVETLHCLESSGAIPDRGTKDGMIARKMAATHIFSRVRAMFEYTNNDFLPRENHRLAIPKSNVLSDGSLGTSQQFNRHGTVPPDTDRHTSFPNLGSPSQNQDRIKHTTISNSIWGDEARKKQLFFQAAPFASHLGSTRERRPEGQTCPAVVRGCDGEGSGAPGNAGDFPISSSARFWSSFVSDPNTPRCAESTPKQQTDATDGASRRKPGKRKWVPLELS